MKFEKIQIENFSSYYGKTSPDIDLKVNDQKPLIIFIGGTGFGKTSLFDAINWGLYGEEYEKDLKLNKDRNIIDYVNETALKDASEASEKVNMAVTIYFEHNLRHYYITQKLVVIPKENKGELKVEFLERITNLREILSSGDHESIPYNKIFLDEILPNNVKSYFLFDGDRIHNLAKPGNSKDVQAAIHRVVDLEIIRNAGKHLNELSKEYTKDAAKASKGDLKKIIEDIQATEKEVSKIKRKEKDNRDNEIAIRSQIELLDEKLLNTEETAKFQARRSQINKDLTNILITRKDKTKELKKASYRASLGFASSQIEQLKSVLESKRNKGEIPKHIQEAFFKDLFELEECICGTSFAPKEGDVIYDKLIARSINEQKKSPEDKKLLGLSYQLKEVIDKITNSKNSVGNIEDELLTIEDDEQELLLEKQEIDNELKNLPQEDIAILIDKRRTREDELINLTKDQKDYDVELENLKKRIKDLKSDRKDLGKKQKEANVFYEKEELAIKAAETIESLYEQFAEESRSAVEKMTISEFQKFVFSSSSYQVRLTKEYELEVCDSNGNRALQRLSMGQSQCLSLAFITAISRVSEKHPPLVIDMPFSRLDSSVHESVSSRLPKISEQTILFLIPDVEWNEKTKSKLNPYASSIYKIEFDEKNRQTSIDKII